MVTSGLGTLLHTYAPSKMTATALDFPPGPSIQNSVNCHIGEMYHSVNSLSVNCLSVNWAVGENGTL